MCARRVGSITRRGDAWHVRVERGFRSDGSRRVLCRTVHGTRADAERAALEMARELEGAWSDMTLREWYARFRLMPSPRGTPRAATTLRGYDQQMGPVLEVLGSVPLASLTHDMTADAVRHAGSPVNCKRVLRAVLRAAYDEGLISWRAFERRVQAHYSYRRAKSPWDAAEAAQALAAQLPDDLRAYLVLGLSGLRMGEALGIRACDIRRASAYSPLLGHEVDTVTATVEWTFTDDGGHVQATKNAQSARTVPIIPQGREWLLSRASAMDPMARVVPLTGQALYSSWRKALRSCGLRFVPPSQLRHTSDTLMLVAGVSPDLNAKMHGRSDPSTTYRHYMVPALGQMEDALRQVSEIVENSPFPSASRASDGGKFSTIEDVPS